jgi:hypothetical protein
VCAFIWIMCHPNAQCVCIFGNALVVCAVLTQKSLKNSTNLLLVSLALADLTLGAIVMPLSIYLLVGAVYACAHTHIHTVEQLPLDNRQSIVQRMVCHRRVCKHGEYHQLGAHLFGQVHACLCASKCV